MEGVAMTTSLVSYPTLGKPETSHSVTHRSQPIPIWQSGITQLVDNVERIYREGEDDKPTQMIFLDIGTPKSKEEGL